MVRWSSITRDDDTTTTLYELVPFRRLRLGLDAYEKRDGDRCGLLCVNDGDTEDGQGGQKGWSGWGPYAAVYGKTASATGLVTLVGEALVGPAVALGKLKYAPGESITVNFSDGPGNPKNWVGLYRPDMTPGSTGSLMWAYVDGTQTGGDGLTDGSVTFADGLPLGDYKAIYFENDGYTQLARSSFSVVDPSVLPEGVYFEEDFDGLVLGAFVSDSESGGDGTDWTATTPTAWVMSRAGDHGPTAGGDDVVEFDGWTFVDPISWNATAGQDRSEFTKGVGVIAVADSDEYDDKADAKFNASLATPAIDISSAAVGALVVTYDSSWRQEPQTGKVTVSFDGGAAITLLRLTPDTQTAYSETITLDLDNPAGAQTAVISWDKQGHNNWWWAIDNIKVRDRSSSDHGEQPTCSKRRGHAVRRAGSKHYT